MRKTLITKSEYQTFLPYVIQPPPYQHLNRALSKGHKPLPEMGDFLLTVSEYKLRVCSFKAANVSHVCMSYMQYLRPQ